jgi:hypothetical protein
MDLAELEKLCSLQCTDGEIAAWFGVTTRTIERRRKEPAFAQVMDRGKAKGRISVRRQQLKLLENGNATMAVWLGKQILGQTDQMGGQVYAGPFVLMIPRELAENKNQGKEESAHVLDVAAEQIG